MASGDLVQTLAGRDHQRIDRSQRDLCPGLRRQQRQRRVDALQPLDIDRQRVEKDVRHRMAGDLRDRRVAADFQMSARRLVHAAGADDQDALRAQMHRGRDRCGLAHRAVAEPAGALAARQLDRRKDEGNRCRGQQVAYPEPGRHRDALRAVPGGDVLAALVEGDMLAAGVAGGRHRQRIQMAVVHQPLQSVEAHHAQQQRFQRAVVQQRARAQSPPAVQQPAEGHHRQPWCAGAHHAQRVGAVDLLGAELRPDIGDLAHRCIMAVGLAGQGGRVDRAGRGAGDDLVGAVRRRADLAGDVGDGPQHAHLIGRTRPAAGQQQPGARLRPCGRRRAHRRQRDGLVHAPQSIGSLSGGRPKTARLRGQSPAWGGGLRLRAADASWCCQSW